MIKVFDLLISGIGNHHTLLLANIISLGVKVFVLVKLILGSQSEKTKTQRFFFFMAILGAMLEDFAWGFDCARHLFFPFFDIRIRRCLVRIAWASFILQYQFLGIFIESIIEKKYRIKLWTKILIPISLTIVALFVYHAIFKFNIFNLTQVEYRVIQFCILYTFALILPSVYYALKKIKKYKYPKIIKNQLQSLIYNMILPLLALELLQSESYFLSGLPLAFLRTQHMALANLTIIIRTYTIFYACKKMMKMRFLNFQKHVQATKPDQTGFIVYFKKTLEQLGDLATLHELQYVTQSFFKDLLKIPMTSTKLYIRRTDYNHNSSINENTNVHKSAQDDIEYLMATNKHANEINKILLKSKVVIKDELEFNNFYDESQENKSAVKFLENINSEVFIPIFIKQNLIAYITIEINARSNKLYSNIENDQMVIFASYLGSIINFLNNKNLNSIIEQDKELKEELYRKHQEANQYKESIRSFLRNNKKRSIGLIFYRNRQFIFANQTAKKLIDIDPNIQEGHHLSHKLKELALQTELYRSSETITTYDSHNNKIIISSIPEQLNNSITFLIYYPEISDILREKMEKLNDPTQLDYLLYLETTESGKLVNQLIPSSSETLMQFKINLLKLALNKGALLLDMPEEDLIPTVEIIHHISLRENLHILSLCSSGKDSYPDIAIKLFGINPIFGAEENTPLFAKLNKSGTLFIKNAYLLDIQTQNLLADYLRYGFYYPYKSDTKIWSDVRVICSTNQNLHPLVTEGLFSEKLYQQLNKTSLALPSLLTLSEDDFVELTEGITEQTIKTQDFKSLLSLSEQEKNNLSINRPVSLYDLKNKIQNILVQKSKNNLIFEKINFDPAHQISDPNLINAARLGKRALRDPKVLSFLWNKFKSQNKIANFLGVNRSSVNRRCKEYNLE